MSGIRIRDRSSSSRSRTWIKIRATTTRPTSRPSASSATTGGTKRPAPRTPKPRARESSARALSICSCARHCNERFARARRRSVHGPTGLSLVCPRGSRRRRRCHRTDLHRRIERGGREAVSATGERPLYDFEQTAQYLGVSKRTLHSLVSNGLISYIAVGLGLKRRRKMFDPEDLARFRERQRRTECPSTSGPGRRRGPTTSSSEVVDFQALRAQRRAARQSASRTGNVRPPARP
ncbi:DNA-binding protein [Methylorubrum sp. Q1]|nr:DNA-binding protein [Methylorubrum sp. Q1]